MEFHDDYEIEREDIYPQYFITVGEMDLFEQLESYEDRFPLL